MDTLWFPSLIGIVVALIALVAISYLIELLRPAPETPEKLKWDPQIPVRHTEINGIRLRYITAGEGPPLVLLHTLRTQLEMFHKVLPVLAKHFRVYALDCPGHGYSDIPQVEYTPQFFVDAVGGFLDRMDLEEAIVAGESIGASIALLLAAQHHPRVKRVIPINSYDYDSGRGALRSSWAAKLVFGLSNVPVLGATISYFDG